MRTANPALNAKTFDRIGSGSLGDKVMTIQGTVNKTTVLLFCLIVPAVWIWNQFYSTGNPGVVMPWMFGGAIGGFIIALVTVFKKQWAPVTAPIYSVLEGFFVGGISAVFEAQFPGIVMQAVGLTMCTLFGLLAAYKSGLIKVTENFRLGVIAATGGIALIYFLSFILRFVGIGIPFIHNSGLLGIGFSLFVVAVAAMNLVLDFDFIESGAGQGAPKYMEWYAAFGLMVTLIWLYIEILRLLAKLKSRK